MTSNYLDVLNASIASTPVGTSHDCLRAERAAYLARLGETATAREEVKRIQADNRVKADARLSILLNIADGLCHYYENMGVESRDRFLRAYALSKATNSYDLTAKAASWLALIEYGAYDFDMMAAYLDQSWSLGRGDESSKVRALLIVALTIHLANRFDIAKKWYQKARYFAANIEDSASTSAIMHNMTSIWAANRRNSTLGGIETEDKSQTALVSAISTMNFDGLIGTTSLPSFTPLIQAQVLSTDGRCEEALELYEAHLVKLRIQSVPGWQKWLLADRAWCLLKSGYADRAKKEFDALLEVLSEDDHVDDLAASLTRLSVGYRLLGDEARSQQCGMRSRDCWVAFARLQQQMLQKVERFSSWLTDV